MDKKDETMNLDALKDFLSDVPADDEFDLDSIIAEVGGSETAEPREKPAPKPRRAEPQPAPRRAEPQPQPQPAPKPSRAAQPGGEALPDLSAFEEEEDPRQARMAARAEKEAEKQRRAAQKRAAKAARLAARGEEDEPEEQAPDEAPAPRRRAAGGEKMTRKEARAARLAAELEEEEEDIELRDPAQAQRAFRRRAQGLSVRSVLVLLLAVIAAYLSIAPSFEALPLPVVLDAVENPGIAIGVLMLLQFLAIFLGVDVFGMGFAGLLHGAPDRSTIVSFAVIASLLHGASIIVFDNEAGVEIPYLAVSILLLYAAMREERGRFAALARAYKAIGAAEQPMAVYSHYDKAEDVCRAVKGPLGEFSDFIREMERPDTVDRFSMIYAPIALAASVVFALIASLGRGEPLRFFWAFSALLSVSAPLGLLCAFGAGYKNVSRRLLSSGAAIAGARQANLLRGTEEVVLTENDLFPTGSITLEALQNMGVMSDDKLLAAAAALTDAAGLELGRVLTGAVRERYGVTAAAQNIRQTEGGVAGEIAGHRIVIGTAALMVKMGVRIRAGQGDNVNAYLVIDNQLAGVLTLRYQPTKSAYQAMRAMRRMHMSVSLAVRDFNISPAMVESQFDLRRGFADQAEPDAVLRMLDPSYTQGDAPAAILTREGAGPLMQVLHGADKLAGATRSNLTLGAFAGVCGMLIVFYLVFQNAAAALPVVNLLLYLLLWYVPVFLITQQTH